MGRFPRLERAIAGASLRAKLAMGFLAVIALSAAGGAASLWSQQRALAAVERNADVSDRVADLSLRGLGGIRKARNHEKDFLLKQRELGFLEARSRYATLLQADLAELRESLALVRRLDPSPETDELTRGIERAASRYETGFMGVVAVYGRLGRVGTGLEGALRERAHALEVLVDARGDVRLARDLLALRRREKDFLLRALQRHVQEFEEEGARFRSDLAASRLPRRDRDRAEDLLVEYEGLFSQYVALRSGLPPQTAEIIAAAGDAELRLERLYARSVSGSSEMRATVRRLTRATGWTIAATTLGAMLAGVLVASKISAMLTRSLGRAMEFAGRIAAGDLTTRMAASGCCGEFSALGTSLNAMADALGRAEAVARRHARALRAMSECSAAQVRATTEAELLADVCRTVVEVGGYRMAWVGAAERDARRTVRPIAHAGHEDGYLSAISPVWDEGAENRGLVGGAICSGKPVIARDLLSDPTLLRWPAEAARRGYASAAALPLVAEDVTLGALCIYAEVIDAFDQDEMRLLAQLADDLAFGIRALRGRAERAAMTAQLVQAGRLVATGTLAAGVAHEINNPLAYVIAAHDFVERELAALAEELPSRDLGALRDALADASDGALRVKRIVRDLKTFSRTDEERQELVDLRRVVDSAASMAANEIKYRARLVKDYRDAPEVLANEGRLGQVVLNLLINAAQAIPEDGAEEHEVRVTTRTADDGRAVLEVRDTGQGIPPDVAARIFDPFFTTKPVGIGTGLGLWVCRNIVSAHGGEIVFESEPGRGTLFRVTLPARAPAERPPREG